MMKITKAVSAAILATAAVVGTPAAFAASDPGLGASDLYIAVWNPTSNKSIFEDLSGTTLNDLTNTATFENPNGFSTSWTIDGTADAVGGATGNLATDLGSGTYQYALFAGDDTGAGNYIGNRMALGLVAGHAAPTLPNGQLIDTGLLGTMEPYIQKVAGASNVATWNTFLGNTTTNGGYWALAPNGPGVLGGSFSMNSYQNSGAQTTGGDLNMVIYVGGGTADSPNDNSTNTLVGNSTGLGKFTLNGNTLSYALAGGVTGVPLPAAVWLLISGLLGLGAVGRRRDGSGAVAV